ncbi:tetratricopeptide repeat protein [Nocardia xishanensis]|uniref:tetratricopeptide repeat protein n=1 Tax=Nocardia xishanensis TaxID=238964 RepID=UPI0008334B73|nr:tetratricopeptide repeat protein [Nocardia xishanensis]
MNEPYSQWHAQNSATDPPLASRYRSADPIRWNGSMVYPMYTERFGHTTTLLSMTLLSAAPPAGLRGHGMGLSVLGGYIDLEGRKLEGIDVWSDALARGTTVTLTPTGPDAVFTLTPVWVDQSGVQRSWMGNYGILVEDTPDGRIALWCSVGEGPPNFANLVVGLGTAAAPVIETPKETVADTITNTEMSTAGTTGSVPYPNGTPAGYAATSPSETTVPPKSNAALRHSPKTIAESPAPAAADPIGDLGARPSQAERGAETGYRGALYDLGVAMFGRGEEDQACELWAQAAQAGHSGAGYDLGVVLFRRGDLVAAEGWWRTSAELRDLRAMAGLAELLDRRGDHAEARMWRARAADERAAEAGQSVGPY